MPRLFVLGGPDAGATYELTGPVVLGRSPHCEVRLRHPSVSRRHAELAPDGDAWVVKDLDSRNGLRHAGQRVERARLTDGDEFVLGELPLRLRMTVGGVTSAEDASPAVGVQAATPESPSASEPVVEGLELEGAELLSSTAAYGPGAALQRGAPGAASPGAPTAPTSTAAPDRDPPELDDRARLIFEMQRKSRGGTLSADLAQRPWPIRMALYLLAMGVALGLAYGAYRGVVGLRG